MRLSNFQAVNKQDLYTFVLGVCASVSLGDKPSEVPMSGGEEEDVVGEVRGVDTGGGGGDMGKESGRSGKESGRSGKLVGEGVGEGDSGREQLRSCKKE